MSSKVLVLLLSLAAQSGVYARPTGPRAIAEISTALVLLNAPSRAWAFVKYSPGSENVCGEACETRFSQFAVIMTGSSAYAVTRIWDGRGTSEQCYDGADVVQSLP